MKKLSLDELGRKSVEEYKQSEKYPIVLVLDNIRSLNNIGSFFRTADAFAVKAIYLCGITACPPHRDIHKTALGATETVQWKYVDKVADAIILLKEAGYEIVCIEQTDESYVLHDFIPSKKIALIFGNEVSGVSEEVLELADKAVEIPQEGTKHSLNVAVCGGIVVWHCYSKLKNC
ncbi:MAG: RNA methyltransferase [Bacteroidales bacterium]|jgi:tRNA G18 (ribose-2'-O)-methylase SpoU|nr:RNA methyltransferase [Bacteroidales bacterium]MDD3700145.1 RNA methyltransferase [Bacteroidales bacterium]MDY0369031.1 RNA methyltransferase [Bacteroidales bacterium]